MTGKISFQLEDDCRSEEEDEVVQLLVGGRLIAVVVFVAVAGQHAGAKVNVRFNT